MLPYVLYFCVFFVFLASAFVAGVGPPSSKSASPSSEVAAAGMLSAAAAAAMVAVVGMAYEKAIQ